MTRGTDQSILVLGATSDIGSAVAHRYAQVGANVILAARSGSDVERYAADLRSRYQVDVETMEFDILARNPAEFLDHLAYLPRSVICVVGVLGSQKTAERDIEASTLLMEVNYVGPVRFLGEVATRMEARRFGTIIGVSSVAGDRGRYSNYIYGSAKAGFSAFLSGLRARMSRANVQVVTVKPGPVRTKMTAGMRLSPFTTASPAEVAEAIFLADQRRQDVVYARRIWLPIMTIIRLLPEPLFKRMSM